MAVIAAAMLRIAGYGVQGLATHHPVLCTLFYLIPLFGAGAAIVLLMGFDPWKLLRGERVAELPA